MSQRADYYTVSPGGVKALYALEQYVRASTLEPALLELVKLRASQSLPPVPRPWRVQHLGPPHTPACTMSSS